MPTVALIGPDGAGKTTICRMMLQSLPLRTKYIYMGVSGDSSNRMLPTTYLLRGVKRALGGKRDNTGPRDHKTLSEAPKNPLKRAARNVKSALSLVNRTTEEWYRQVLVWSYELRGRVVLFDRHFFVDYYAYDIAPTSEPRAWNRKVHGWLLSKVYPKPDLVVYLDAPSEVLFARKGEGTIELLDRRRNEYLELRNVLPRFIVVDANRPLEEVARDVQDEIVQFCSGKTERPSESCV